MSFLSKIFDKLKRDRSWLEINRKFQKLSPKEFIESLTEEERKLMQEKWRKLCEDLSDEDNQ